METHLSLVSVIVDIPITLNLTAIKIKISSKLRGMGNGGIIIRFKLTAIINNSVPDHHRLI